MRQISQNVLQAATAVDDSAVADLRRLALVEAIHTVKWGEGVSAGEIAIETAGHPEDTDWALLTKVTFDAAAPAQGYARTTGAYGAIRHRVLTLEGGPVTTKIQG